MNRSHSTTIALLVTEGIENNAHLPRVLVYFFLVICLSILVVAHEHLSNKDTYKLLREDPTQEINKQLIEYPNTCKEHGVFALEQLQRYA